MEHGTLSYAATFPVTDSSKWTRRRMEHLVPIVANELETGKKYDGRVLICKVIAECISVGPLMTTCEDSKGDRVSLAVFKYSHEAAIFKDRWLAIAEPVCHFFKEFTIDGTNFGPDMLVSVRVHDPYSMLGFDPEPFSYAAVELFEPGSIVSTHSLSTSCLDGIVGPVHGWERDRVIVDLPPHGKKLLKPSNLFALCIESPPWRSEVPTTSSAEVKILQSIDPFTGLCQKKFLTEDGTELPDFVSMSRNLMHFLGGPSFELTPGQKPPPEFFETAKKMMADFKGPDQQSTSMLESQENPDNLRNMAAVYGQPEGTTKPTLAVNQESPAMSVGYGAHLIIHGLKTRTDLNGKFGWSLGPTEHNRVRVMVSCMESPVALRQENFSRGLASTGYFYNSSFGEHINCAQEMCREIHQQLFEFPKVQKELSWQARFAERAIRQVSVIFKNQAAVWRDPVRSAILLEAILKAMRFVVSSHPDAQKEPVAALGEVFHELQAELWLVAIWSKLLGQAPCVSVVTPIAIETFALLGNISEVEHEQENVIQDCVHDEPPATHDPLFESEYIYEAWAQSVEAAISNNMGSTQESADRDQEENAKEDVFILAFTRYPEAWRQALMEGTPLRNCRDALSDEGYQVALDSGCKVFVHPWQYPVVMEKLAGMTLRPYHVVVSASFEHLVEESLLNIPRRHKINIRSRDAVAFVADQDEPMGSDGFPDGSSHMPENENQMREAWEQAAENHKSLFETKRTFLCCVHLRNSASVVQSTTEAHGGVNPRRYVAVDEGIP